MPARKSRNAKRNLSLTARAALKLPEDFVIHSLRHTMLTRLGEAGADAFAIMRIAGHGSVNPTPEGMKRTRESPQGIEFRETGP